MTTKSVFISYTHDSDNHKAWVRKLSEDLINNGVKVLLDQWHLHIGDDLSIFMEKSISHSDYTLLICTPNFAEKVNNRNGGVAYETDLIIGQILSSTNDKSKYIPVLREGLASTSIPRYLSSRLFIDFQTDFEYQKSLDILLRKILEAPLYVPPRLGQKPLFPPNSVNYKTKNQNPKAKILVAGLGIVEYLNDDIILISQKLGKELAKSNFGLVTGGWPGVDEIVAREFSEELLKSNLPLENYLTQIIVKTDFPTYTGGNIILVEQGDPEWSEPVNASDALVVINGMGGTYSTAMYSMRSNIPVFPVADSGGDASKLYLEIITDWERYQYKKLQKNQFQQLGRPFKYAIDSLIDLLNLQFDN